MCDEDEMHTAIFMPINVLFEYFGDKLFAPFKQSLEIYRETEQIGQLSEVENSMESGIIDNTDQEGPGAPLGNDNAAKDHVPSEVKGPNGKMVKLEHNPNDYTNVKFGTGDNDSSHNIGGFEGKGKKDAHIRKHAKEMGLSEKEYAKKAYDFLSKPLSDTMEEMSVEGRPGYSKTYRYDYSTNEFGVINPNGNISSYYRLKKGANQWENMIKDEGCEK